MSSPVGEASLKTVNLNSLTISGHIITFNFNCHNLHWTSCLQCRINNLRTVLDICQAEKRDISYFHYLSFYLLIFFLTPFYSGISFQIKISSLKLYFRHSVETMNFQTAHHRTAVGYGITGYLQLFKCNAECLYKCCIPDDV